MKEIIKGMLMREKKKRMSATEVDKNLQKLLVKFSSEIEKEILKYTPKNNQKSSKDINQDTITRLPSPKMEENVTKLPSEDQSNDKTISSKNQNIYQEEQTRRPAPNNSGKERKEASKRPLMQIPQKAVPKKSSIVK